MPDTTIITLDDLLDVLRALPSDAHHPELPDAPNDPGVDWTSLPVFGGTEPRDTECVWSWDATRLLIGTCANDLRIVDRD